MYIKVVNDDHDIDLITFCIWRDVGIASGPVPDKSCQLDVLLHIAIMAVA
jgi:hypothetical protein